MHNKLIDTIEGSVALIAFVAIAVISVSSVMALNPKEEVSTQSSVAGIQTDSEILPNTNSNKVDITSVELFEKQNGIYEITKLDGENLRYLITIREFTSPKIVIPFISFKNVSGLNGNVTVKSYVDSSLAQSLNINFVDQFDTLILNNAQTLEGKERNITLKSPAKRDFSLEIIPQSQINFTYQFEIEIL